MAFAYQTHFYTNNFSEAYVALIGVSWCCDKNIRNIEMELDSIIVINMIKGVTRPSWRLQNIIDDIQHKMHQKNVTISHCYRESNGVADALAKHATTLQEDKVFLHKEDLPKEAIGPLRMDKMQLPSFRRAKKHFSWCYEPP
ncbi:hypothetical protein KY284_017538 [Solanum tuberosum]|nr:hypothetical protein KY284_017538 [Solanum tuberosum]